MVDDYFGRLHPGEVASGNRSTRPNFRQSSPETKALAQVLKKLLLAARRSLDRHVRVPRWSFHNPSCNALRKASALEAHKAEEPSENARPTPNRRSFEEGTTKGLVLRCMQDLSFTACHRDATVIDQHFGQAPVRPGGVGSQLTGTRRRARRTLRRAAHTLRCAGHCGRRPCTERRSDWRAAGSRRCRKRRRRCPCCRSRRPP